MSDVKMEELKRRKEHLLLEQEVARLERKQSLSKAADWSWKWLAPLTAVGAYAFLGGLAEGAAPAVVIGIIALCPLGLKLYFKRSG